MRFVNEKDDRRGRRLDLFDQPFQTIFKCSRDASSGLEEGKIERADSYILQRWRDVAGGDAQRKPFDDGSLAAACLAGENRIVLTAASENVNDLADLVVAAEYRVHLSRTRIGSEINSELIQILRFTAARSTGRCGRPDARNIGSLRRLLIFRRAGDDSPEILAQRLLADFLEFTRDFAHQSHEIR